MPESSFIKEIKQDEYEETFKDYIEDIIWNNSLALFIRKFNRFILRLIRWIPVLWKQEEWDFGYTYDILKHKIQEVRKCVAEDDWHTRDCVEEELKQIDSVLLHLDKFRNWTDYIKIPDPPKDFQRWTDCENGCIRIQFTEEEHKAYQKAHEFEEEHYNAFWDELKKYSSNWWT